MFRFLDSLKSKPKIKFSLENLQYLYNVLIKNPAINEQNKGLIVETLRQIAEVMIWGDQHSPDFFDFFAEKNIIGYFLKILNQKGSREVHVQLIQTLSILLENTKNQHSIYYILSNNHINELITHKFDFSDDELLAYYISFLKALSLKLNSSTIQFFFNERANDFPLYTEAIKFFNHKEAMIRIAVRTLTLNVYKVEDDAMRRYILDKAAAPYFSNIVWYIRDQCSSLDTMVINVNASMDYYSKAKLEDFVAELLDYFYYLHDIFNQRISMMSEVLCIHMLECLLLPQFVKSLIPKREQEHLSKDEDIVNIAHIPPEYSDLDDHISPVLAVYCLSCVFYIFSSSKLVNTLAARILHPNSEEYLNSFYHTQPASDNKERVFLALPTIPLKHKFRKIQSDSNLLSMVGYKLTSPQNSNADKHSSETSGKTDSNVSTKYYSKLLSLLESDDRTVLGVAALLYAMIKSPGIDQSLLEISGLCPFKLTKAKRLLEALTSDDQTDLNNNKNMDSETNTTVEEDLSNPVKDKSIHNRSASDGLLRLPSENFFSSPMPSRGLLIDSLLQILLKSSSFRVVTVQLVSMILKELVFIPDEPANLTDNQKGMLQESYEKSAQALTSCLSGNLSGIFLELFENEVRSARALNFDQLMTDCVLFLLPVPESSMSGVNLSKRLPGTDTEKLQKAIQEFLVIRELKFTLSNIVDSFLPLKADPVPPVKVKDHLTLNGNILRETVTEDNGTNLEASDKHPAESSATNVVDCWVLVGSGATRKKLKRIIYLHQEAPFISILEPDPRAPADTQSFIVSQVVPLQNLEILRESSMDEEYGFQMICHPITWSAAFAFDDLPTCTEVLRLLEQAKLKARAAKTQHIENILNS